MSLHELDRRAHYELRCDEPDCTRRTNVGPGDFVLGTSSPRLSARVNWQTLPDASHRCPEHRS